MYQKNCEICHRASYSSSEVGKWICPICGNDLTNQPFFDAMTFERIHIKTVPLHRKLKKYQK
ncbi:hypothetical protein [Robertmurraya andreesenii]|uniref:Ribosomal protein L37AE/L43A n=1 Tax=Anoxybacillus andreesenii TaxID=1325932 RepID=A0ABT9V3N7_9BACL|nr:hypothetical protein [Robertmurraya andreesenii]MDQ0155558.1 ribosomal protein L37AE/L43A [Robertmurraya andreesenii]